MNWRSTAALALCMVGIFRGETLAADAHNTLSADEVAEGWISLFDGETLFGWEPATKANWAVADGVISVSEGERGLLCTTSDFADYQLKLSFRAAKGTNSGVFLRVRPDKIGDITRDCYELNIAEPSVSPFSTGGFVNRQKATDDVATNDWQTFDITAMGGRFTIAVDGKTVLEYADPNPVARGRIGLQLNSGKVEFRDIKLKPLGMSPLFNEHDLAGWRLHPENKSVFSVTSEGYLNVKNGRGQLETEGEYGDFVLQLEVFSNGKHLNSGVFFRSIPGEMWNGYESQIQNGFNNDDRAQPIDAGTGAIYRRTTARKVVPNDFEWFAKTIVATGPHLAVWVNGYQVTDWTDERPTNANPRNGRRVEPGTIIIQGHDPTTDLSFRHLNIVELPAKR